MYTLVLQIIIEKWAKERKDYTILKKKKKEEKKYYDHDICRWKRDSFFNFNVPAKVNLVFFCSCFDSIIAHTMIAIFTLTMVLTLSGK